MGTSVGPGCGARWDPLLPGALPHVPPKVAGAGGAPRPAAPHYTRLQPLSTKPRHEPSGGRPGVPYTSPPHVAPQHFLRVPAGRGGLQQRPPEVPPSSAMRCQAGSLQHGPPACSSPADTDTGASPKRRQILKPLAAGCAPQSCCSAGKAAAEGKCKGKGRRRCRTPAAACSCRLQDGLSSPPANPGGPQRLGDPQACPPPPSPRSLTPTNQW